MDPRARKKRQADPAGRGNGAWPCSISRLQLRTGAAMLRAIIVAGRADNRGAEQWEIEFAPES